MTHFTLPPALFWTWIKTRAQCQTVISNNDLLHFPLPGRLLHSTPVRQACLLRGDPTHTHIYTACRFVVWQINSRPTYWLLTTFQSSSVSWFSVVMVTDLSWFCWHGSFSHTLHSWPIPAWSECECCIFSFVCEDVDDWLCFMLFFFFYLFKTFCSASYLPYLNIPCNLFLKWPWWRPQAETRQSNNKVDLCTTSVVGVLTSLDFWFRKVTEIVGHSSPQSGIGKVLAAGASDYFRYSTIQQAFLAVYLQFNWPKVEPGLCDEIWATYSLKANLSFICWIRISCITRGHWLQEGTDKENITITHFKHLKKQPMLLFFWSPWK